MYLLKVSASPEKRSRLSAILAVKRGIPFAYLQCYRNADYPEWARHHRLERRDQRRMVEIVNSPTGSTLPLSKTCYRNWNCEAIEGRRLTNYTLTTPWAISTVSTVCFC